MAPLAVAEEEKRTAELLSRFPDASENELLRFVRARPASVSEAADMYEAHLAWRRGDGSQERLKEASLAVSPEYIRHSGQALDGTPLMFVQGARYDPSIPPEQYVLACAAAASATLPPDDLSKLTVLIDVRPAHGWPNVPAPKMLPLFKLLCGVLP